MRYEYHHGSGHVEKFSGTKREFSEASGSFLGAKQYSGYMLTGCGCYSGFHKGTEVFRSGRRVFESWYRGFSCKRAVCAWLLVRSVVFNRLEGVLSVQLSFVHAC